jgi:hypothetical protein
VTTSATVRDKYQAAVAAAHVAETSSRARPPHRLSVSKLGGCTRQAAYALAGTPVSDTPPPAEARAANLGTWFHLGFLPRLADQVGGKHETDVIAHAAGLAITGQTDLAVVESADGGEIVDVKTVDGLDVVRRYGPYGDHWVQVFAYALGETQRTGRLIRWAVLIYVDRGTGAEEIFVREITPAGLLAVINRVRDIIDAAADPDTAPRLTAAMPGGRRWRMKGPGKSKGCDECPFLSRCWPGAKSGVVGAQASIVRTDAAIEAALGAYGAAARTVSDAASEQDFWRSVLAGSPAGIYGSWRLTWTKSGSIRVTAARALEEAS